MNCYFLNFSKISFSSYQCLVYQIELPVRFGRSTDRVDALAVTEAIPRQMRFQWIADIQFVTCSYCNNGKADGEPKNLDPPNIQILVHSEVIGGRPGLHGTSHPNQLD